MAGELKGATNRKNQKLEEYQSGKQAEKAGDYEMAAAHYKKAADLKNASAELALGKLYYFGNGVPQNYEEAHLHLQRARETVKNREEEAEALYYIAQMFRHGLGVKKHFWRAFNRLKLSADLGNNEAMYTLGEMWENGEYEWDSALWPRAKNWYCDAAYAGNVGAMRKLAQYYETGECDFPKNEEEAAYWKERAEVSESAETQLNALLQQARNGKASAMKKLGDLYMTGDGVEKDKNEAVEWYRKSAEANDGEAMDKLIQIYDDSRKKAKAAYLKKKGQLEELDAEVEYWKWKKEGYSNEA